MPHSIHRGTTAHKKGACTFVAVSLILMSHTAPALSAESGPGKITRITQAATKYSPHSYQEPKGTFTGRHDSHTLPLIYMAGNDDYSQDNRALREHFQQEGIHIYDWYPTEITDKANVRKFQHPEWYITSLDSFIKGVMRTTGSSKVNIMAFSQSGVIAATWMKNHGGAQYVDQVVNISAALQGSPTATIGTELLPECLGIQGCPAMSSQSNFITQLNTPATTSLVFSTPISPRNTMSSRRRTTLTSCMTRVITKISSSRTTARDSLWNTSA